MANDLYAEVSSPDPVIGRFLAQVRAEELGNIVGVTRNECGMTVGWVWLPESVLSEWEGKAVFNVQVGKYAFEDYDD